MGKCIVEGCERTDMAPHPRGGEGYKCHGHEDSYFDRDCCEATFISTALDVVRTDAGFPLCDDCEDHDEFQCREET